MSAFTANQEVSTNSICDSNCVFRGTIIKRTAKTVTLKMHGVNGIQDMDARRCKIHLDSEGNEFVYPLGRFSMAPIFRA